MQRFFCLCGTSLFLQHFFCLCGAFLFLQRFFCWFRMIHAAVFQARSQAERLYCDGKNCQVSGRGLALRFHWLAASALTRTAAFTG